MKSLMRQIYHDFEIDPNSYILTLHLPTECQIPVAVEALGPCVTYGGPFEWETRLADIHLHVARRTGGGIPSQIPNRASQPSTTFAPRSLQSGTLPQTTNAHAPRHLTFGGPATAINGSGASSRMAASPITPRREAAFDVSQASSSEQQLSLHLQPIIAAQKQPVRPVQTPKTPIRESETDTNGPQQTAAIDASSLESYDNSLVIQKNAEVRCRTIPLRMMVTCASFAWAGSNGIRNPRPRYRLLV